MTFDAIAEWFNKEGYLTVRGKKFRGAHVHSILKKRLAKEELLNRDYPPVWSDFSMEVVDKTILMSNFGFPEKGKWGFFMTSRFFSQRKNPTKTNNDAVAKIKSIKFS